jgi:hypothetical protein
MDRQALMFELYAGRERLRAALATIPDRAMLDRVDDEWTRKDVVAHLAAWERRLVDLFERLRRGEWPDEAYETDELNARMHALDRERTLDDVRVIEEAAWSTFLAAVEGMTDEELFEARHFGWTQGDPFVEWVTANANGHIDEHLEQLTRPARSARADRAEGRRPAIA